MLEKDTASLSCKMQQVASHVGAHQKVPSGGTKEVKGNRSCYSPPAALPHKLGYLITTQHELHWELPALCIDQDLCAPLQHLCSTSAPLSPVGLRCCRSTVILIASLLCFPSNRAQTQQHISWKMLWLSPHIKLPLMSRSWKQCLLLAGAVSRAMGSSAWWS